MVFGEACLADNKVHVGVLIQFELDFSTLDIRNRFTHIGGHGTGLGVGHQAAGSQNLTEPTDFAHQLGCRDSGVKVGVTTGYFLNELIATDLVGASGRCCLGSCARREDDHASSLAGSVRKANGSADQLVSLALVHTKLESNLDG